MEKFDMVSPQITLDISKVKKININTASVDDLRKHPYMDKTTAVKIFWHRVNKGDYSDVSDIKKLNLVGDELYSKIESYLTVK
ncbi:MAG: helix-hairpin-helix domain-containing protein [Bacteroidetes bacterium]|nr:helix-hairpin-helix domain-containing protein [Bacteroidota bacterium]